MAHSIIVENTLPTHIVALSDDTMAQVQALTVEAAALVPTDAAGLEQGNALFRRIDQLGKAIKEQRLEITRPIDALKDAIMEAERGATRPLAEAKGALGERLLACEGELKRQAAEAARKAREEAEAVAKFERARLEAERQELIRKQAEERAAAEAKAKEEAALFGTEAEPLPPAEEPPPVVVVPVVEHHAVVAPLPKAAVRKTSRPVLVIDDASKIPLQIGGKRLLVPDEKVIEALLKAGIEIPGCHLESVSGMASAGSR